MLVNGMHGQTATTFAGKTITISAEIDLSAYFWKPIGCDSDHYFSGTLNGSNQTITGMMVNETNAEFNGVGLFGRANGMIRELTVTNSTVVSDGYHTGGIVGHLDNTTLLNCSYSGTVTGFSIVGGLVGTPNNSNVHKCTNYATVTVTGTDGKAGGIAGNSMGYIDNCANFGEIKGTNIIGGVAGQISYGSVKNSYSIGAVSATNGLYVGGIAAYVNPPSTYGTSVTNCYYLKGTAAAGLYSAVADLKANVTEKESTAFASGEVAWLLNGSVDGGSNWYQNLDNGKTKDDNPVLLSTHGKVYQFITYARCDKGDTNPVITYSNSDTSDVVPAHVYQYKATDNVITETCKNCETHTETATIKIDSSVDLVYAPNTEHKPATVEYSDGWLGDTLTVTYENNINAGTDTAKAMIEKDGEKATLSFSIKQATNKWTTEPTISGWTYGETASTPNGAAKFGTVKVIYTGKANDGSDYNSETAPTKAGNYTATFTVAGNSNYSGLEKAVDFEIDKATYDMSGAKWDYSEPIKYDGNPHTVYVDESSLPNGVSVSRYTGNNGSDAKKYTANVSLGYDIYNYNQPEFNYILEWEIKNDWTPTEYTVTKLNDKGWINGDFVITAADGYKVSLTNTANGVWEDKLTYTAETDSGEVTFYLKNETDGTISLAKTENYKLDKTNPTGTVEFVGREPWQEFVNTITFGLFFKDEVTVKAEATDALSGVASIEYYEADEMKTLDEIKAITEWTAMPANGVGVTVEDAKKFVYFIRITDNAGNVTYLSTDGAEYDTTLPAISGIENGATYYTTQVVTVEDKNLASVELDGETVTLDNGTLTLAGNVDATYTIKVTDKAGNIIEYTVTMKTIAELTKSLDDITVDDVTSDDKETTLQVIGDIDEQLANDDLTEDEKAALEETKDKAQDLLDKIDEAANADDTENTEAARDITTENVTPEDKSDLEKAKEDLTKALDDYSDNLTEDEKKAIEDEIKRIDDALEVIGNVEAVEDKIGSLPENITKNDEAAIKAADDAYNALSDYEKSLVDKDAKKALDDAKAALAELNKPADTTSPNTGDNSNLWLWVALLFISGGGVITLTVVDRKRRAKEN